MENTSDSVKREGNRYLSGGERGRAAVSSVVLAVGPVVDGVAPAVPSERLNKEKNKNQDLPANCHSPLTQHKKLGGQKMKP